MKFNKSFFLIGLLIFIAFTCLAQNSGQNNAQKQVLNKLSKNLSLRDDTSYRQALKMAVIKGWKLRSGPQHGNSFVLKGIDTLGFPVYYKTWNNTISAATTQTNTVQPGGVLGLALSGSNVTLAGKLAIWDEGIVNATHVEFAGKSITIGDGSTNIADHATHAAGTMIAKGINPLVKGMAFGASTLQTYDFNNDQSEMAKAAGNLLISNHSYGYEAGWNFNSDANRWEWVGLPGDQEDYKFGFYSSDAQIYDAIAFSAPDYLIVEAAGNSHEETGPPVGSRYYGYASKTDATLVNKGARPAGISSNDGYDVISGTANAKNIMTVGAVNPLPNGPITGSNITIASFSSWGPTDDGRIKPDICGNGINVLSTGAASPNAYFTISGTSTAAPNISGSLFLLQEYYAQKHNGDFMRSATLKGIACHTAVDAGNIGPDYVYGWGLLDMKSATQVITDINDKSIVTEQTISQGQSQSFQVTATGNSPLKATLSWTDPPGTLIAAGTINNRRPTLTNDLDIRISSNQTSYLPWVLNPDNPSAAATTGDNMRDNLEQVTINAPMPGKTYTISVSHKGHLVYGLQNYSLIVTGIQNTRNPDLINDASLTIYPIPAKNSVTISLNTLTAAVLVTDIYSTTGQRVYHDDKKIITGAYASKIDMSKVSVGIYIAIIKIGDKIYKRKITLVN